MAATETAEVMITPGSFTEERVVRGIKKYEPNRFYGEGEPVPPPDDPDYLNDMTGYISLSGKRTPVRTGYWGDVEIWQVDDDTDDGKAKWPKCPTCGTALDIGSALIWRCYTCNPTPMMRQKGA